MAIVVGSARIDENGNISGGKPGDQKQKSSTNDTVGEVSMQNMYTHAKGWYILRPKSIDHANKIAERMKAACNNTNIGYDQENRLGVITYGIDTKTKTECDCSSIVRECVKEATGTDPGNFNTETEINCLSKTGLFMDKISYVSQAKTPVYNGDILVTKTKGHTVIAVSGNPRKVSATTNTTAKSTKLTVDGSGGPLTVKRAQKVFGTTVDGKISNQLKANKPYVAGFVAGGTIEWSSKKSGSSLVKAIQKWAGCTADGWWGKDTSKAVQKKLGIAADGYFGTNSMKTFQTWLNKQP